MGQFWQILQKEMYPVRVHGNYQWLILAKLFIILELFPRVFKTICLWMLVITNFAEILCTILLIKASGEFSTILENVISLIPLKYKCNYTLGVSSLVTCCTIKLPHLRSTNIRPLSVRIWRVEIISS